MDHNVSSLFLDSRERLRCGVEIQIANHREELRSRSREFARVRNFSRCDSSNLCLKQRSHADRFSGKRHELDLVSGPALIDMDNCSDITCLQPFAGKVLGQHNENHVR